MQQRKKANETNGREPRNGKTNATSDALNAEARERAKTAEGRLNEKLRQENCGYATHANARA